MSREVVNLLKTLAPTDIDRRTMMRHIKEARTDLAEDARKSVLEDSGADHSERGG